MILFTGKRVDGVAEVFKDGRPFSPERSLKCRNHSPTGFEWGYCGSGPAQLALAILLELTITDTALDEYQHFKAQVISQLDPIWILTEEQIRKWLVRDLEPK